MCHDNQRELSYNNGSYNFDSSFSSLKDLFGEHDYIACNMESPICEPPYMGFPKFNTPVEFADSLMDVGANIFFLANNHINDRGESGIESTINKLTTGYTKVLEVNGVGYKVSKAGKTLTLNLGYSHPVVMEDPEGIESTVADNKITITGIDKEKVGQYAAEIRDKRRPEPYKGKGIKYADEVIRRKVGKTGKK